MSTPTPQFSPAPEVASTWPRVPAQAPTSWGGWARVPGGLEFPAAVTSSGGPAPYSRQSWEYLPDRNRDDFYLVGGATYNGINAHSTFATPAVMRGFLRAVKAVTGVRL